MIPTITSSSKSPAADSSVPILCCYTNITRRIQIIRITNIPDSPWERVIFPGQSLMFEAVQNAKLEIKFSENRSVLVPCYQLRVTGKTN
jgi:hypothetical protein